MITPQQRSPKWISKNTALLSFALAGTFQINAQITYSFSTCGATGRYGPNQGQVTTAYQTGNLNGQVTSSNGIQLWTVPTSGNYEIEAMGATGGCEGQPFGGKGATMKGTFNLTAGTVLKIIVGQKGTDGFNYGSGGFDGGGGGGGSFVATNANVPLIVAGGGGGKPDPINVSYPSQMDAFITTGGGHTTSSMGGGVNGSGGDWGVTNGPAAGGGGFLTDGVSSGNSTGGKSFLNGGDGGNDLGSSYAGGVGGFGGGGGAWHNSYDRGGGGGGYSGGQGASWTVITPDMQGAGGGGGSFNSGTNQVNTAGTGTAHGRVIITFLCNVNLTSSKNPVCSGETITLSTNAVGGILWGHNGSTASQVNVSPTSSTAYTVTGQAASGCTAAIVTTVVVNPLPNLAAVVSPSVLCVGKDATLTASGANTYTWTTLSQTGAVATVNPPVTTAYNVSGTNQFGCVNTTLVNVTVNTNQLGITSNTSVCLGSPVQLALSNAVTYTWSTGNNFATTLVTPLTNTTYMASGTDIYNCVLSNMVAVTVNQKPNVIANTSKGTVCKGESVTLTGGGATTYTWSNGGTGASVIVTLPAETVYNYAVTGTDANGCVNTANVQVTANRCTGINEASKESMFLSVYPNPALAEVTVESGAGQLKSIEVTDLSGRTVMTLEAKGISTRVNMCNLSDGVYYFKVRSADAVEIIKVVKGN